MSNDMDASDSPAQRKNAVDTTSEPGSAGRPGQSVEAIVVRPETADAPQDGEDARSRVPVRLEPATDISPADEAAPSFLTGLLQRIGLAPPADETTTESATMTDAGFDQATPSERLMVGNILRLRELRVIDVMTPRADIVAISDDADLEDATAAFERGGFSRVPVFHETLDDPIGFIHMKHLAIRYGVGCERNSAQFKPAEHLHHALFVPPSMGIVSLLQKMQGERVHMALVIDEFGGVDGLVTIEDLVEQIVGDIEDEHDTDDAEQWSEAAPGVFTIDARADIEAFQTATGLTLRPEEWEEDVDTLGGLVFMLSGRVATRGEVIAHPHGHEFLIIDADPRRIKRLRLTLNGAARNRPTQREAAE